MQQVLFVDAEIRLLDGKGLNNTLNYVARQKLSEIWNI